MNFLLVAVGGFFGSILRYYLSFILNKRIIATWIANLSGSVLLAILAKYYLEYDFPENLWLLLGIGFCGAYTTFSTFGKETLELLLDKKYLQAMLYIATSVIVTFIDVFCILLSEKGLSMKLRTFSNSIHLFLLILMFPHDHYVFIKIIIKFLSYLFI